MTPATIENRFSGERTIELTQHIPGDEAPHPVGSEENRQVKERILAWLDEHGIESEVQQTWGCGLAWVAARSSRTSLPRFLANAMVLTLH